MRGLLVVSASVVALLPALMPGAWAQTAPQRIDSAHSTASLTVSAESGGNSWNVGIAKVSGMVQWDEKDVTRSVFDFNIYPARQGARLLNPDGSIRSYTSAELSRYTVMTFRSDHVEADQSGRLQVHGTLTITHVEREANIDWNNAYTGPEYGSPIPHSAAGEVVFIMEILGPPAPVHAGARSQISGYATIHRREFAGLQTSMLDAVWPIVVEDEHCVMPAPKPSLRDYSGAICTGNPIEVTPINQPSQRFGIDYPGPDQVTAPAADRTTIVLRLNLLKANSGPGAHPPLE